MPDQEAVDSLAVSLTTAGTDEADRQNRPLVDDLAGLKGRAVEAGYAERPRESEALLLQAFELATTLADWASIREISLSLAHLYVTGLADIPRARQWVRIVGEIVNPDDSSVWREYLSVIEALRDTERQRATNGRPISVYPGAHLVDHVRSGQPG